MRTLVLLAFAVTLWCDSLAGEPPPFPERLATVGFRDVLARSGNVLISGQPSPAGLERARMLGVKTVINLRTDMEMENRDVVPYDEAEAVSGVGMNYVRIPLGGPETPYNETALATFSQALAAAGDEPVLVHCTVGWRASHLWAAWLATDGNLDLPEAVRHAEAINFGTLPLSGFLGGQIEYTLK